MGDHAKDLAREADREREARETAVKTAKEKMKAAEIAEKKAVAAEKNRALVEKRFVELLRAALEALEACWRLAKRNGIMKALFTPRIPLSQL